MTNIRFVFDISNIRTFSCYSFRFEIRSYKRISSFMSSAAKLVPDDLLLSDLTMKKTTTAKLLLTYMYSYTHTRLQNKITNIT